MSDRERCKKEVWHDFHSSQCSRFAVEDGYCRQHHPDSVKARLEASEVRFREAQRTDRRLYGAVYRKALRKIIEIGGAPPDEVLRIAQEAYDQ